MATTVYSKTITGTAGGAWPTEWLGNGSTGFITDINGDGSGLRFRTGTVGGFADFTHANLEDAATTALTDYGVLFQFDFPNPMTDESIAVYLRSSNDGTSWANSNNPDTWARTSLDVFGGADIKHRLASAAQVLDVGKASGTVALTNGASNWCRFEVIGNVLQSKWWSNNIIEPGSWTMQATMAASIVPGPGRVKINLLGASAAGVQAYLRIRNFQVYDLSTGSVSPPSSFPAYLSRLRPVRARRRR